MTKVEPTKNNDEKSLEERCENLTSDRKYLKECDKTKTVTKCPKESRKKSKYDKYT